MDTVEQDTRYKNTRDTHAHRWTPAAHAHLKLVSRDSSRMREEWLLFVAEKGAHSREKDESRAES